MSKREIEELMRGAHKNPAALAQYAEFQQKQQQKEMQRNNSEQHDILDSNSKNDSKNNHSSSGTTDERKKNAIVASKLRWQGRFSQEFIANYRNKNNSKKNQIVTMPSASQKVTPKINNAKRIPTWILDPNSGKWVRNSENSKTGVDDQEIAAESENVESKNGNNKFPLENPTFFGNNSSWSFSDAEFELVTKRINAERPTLDGYVMDLASTKKLFFFVNQKFGSDFSAIADRWNFEENENETSEESSSSSSSICVSSCFLYRHFCLFVSTLADIRRESLALVLEATSASKSSLAKNTAENNNNNKVATSRSTTLTNIINALFKEHPLLRAAPYFVVDSQDLKNRQEFLDLKASQISQEDCMGKEFQERMKEIENQASIFQAKCGNNNNRGVGENPDVNNSLHSSSMIQNTFAECDKAAAMSLLFAEQRRYFSFVPGSIRSSIDDFIFVDLPATGGGGGGGGGGGIQQQNIGNSTNQNQNTFAGNSGGPTTASTTTKSHKDLEDFLERHLQCFVPAASAEIMKRIDALRCLVAATAVVDREVMRVKSVTNGMSKVLDEIAQLKHEVEMNSNDTESIQNGAVRRQRE